MHIKAEAVKYCLRGLDLGSYWSLLLFFYLLTEIITIVNGFNRVTWYFSGVNTKRVKVCNMMTTYLVFIVYKRIDGHHKARPKYICGEREIENINKNKVVVVGLSMFGTFFSIFSSLQVWKTQIINK